MQATTVYIGNTAEAFAGPILKAPAAKRARQTALESALSQRSLYWGGDDKVVITSEPVPDWVLACALRAFHWSSVRVVCSQGGILDMCRSLLDDSAARTELMATLARVRPAISPYCFTPGFRDLVLALRAADYAFDVPEEPASDSEWVRDYLDSKVGFRLEATQLLAETGPCLPDGFVCSTVNEAIEVSRWFHSRRRPCVIKANRGESCWGCFPRPIDQPIEAADAELARIREDGIWSAEPFVVEEFVSAQTNDSAFPSVEAYVDKAGVKILYSCLQSFDPSGFRGVIVGDNIVPRELSAQMAKAAKRVGNHFRALGYRGYFDMDFIVDRQGKLFTLEANARRTGGTHVYDISTGLALAGWTPGCLLSEDGLEHGAPSVCDFRSAVSKLLFPIDGECRGVFITQLTIEIPICGYVAVGRDLTDARSLQRRLYKSLQIGNVVLDGGIQNNKNKDAPIPGAT